MAHLANSAANGRAPRLLAALLMGLALLTAGCGDSFLEPEPKSFLTPENTFTSEQGLRGLVIKMEELLRDEYYSGNNAAYLTELWVTDIAIEGQVEAHHFHDLTNQLTPNDDAFASTTWFWSQGYEGVSYANLVIASIDNVEDWSSEEDKNAVLANGYFFRAYWYYRLAHQFGDIPVYLDAINAPRLDFNTYSREAILKKMRDDMEFAVEHLPVSVQPGEVSQAAGHYLLTKIYLSLTQFQDAVDAASAVLDGGAYALMTERFGQGPHADDPRFNVLWDLHQKENRSIAANTEGILVVQDDFGLAGSTGSGKSSMRNFVPYYWDNVVKDPAGAHATTDGPEGNPLADTLGRGLGRTVTVPYFNEDLWEGAAGDLRHSDVNWFSKDEYYYNNPSSEHYGEPFAEGFVGDAFRTWYPFMYNKLYVPDETSEHRKDGGHTDWYVFRLAGLHLLRAEAYYWLGQMGEAAADINAVRERAEAPPISPAEATIGYIFDERARELYAETPRKTEMTRVAYIMAQLRRDGYSLESMHEDNWYYDRVIEKNVFYREQIQNGANPYRMDPHHVYWPVPQDEIDSNVEGHINQTPGYTGAGSNVEPLGYEALLELAAQQEGEGS